VKKERKATNSGGGRGEDTVFSFLKLYRFWHSPKWRRPMCVRWFFLKILDIFFKDGLIFIWNPFKKKNRCEIVKKIKLENLKL
jgi:hypothetical protein